ncbi:MAG: cytochrome c oxidase subunit II [Marinicellaceae bacterium]
MNKTTKNCNRGIKTLIFTIFCLFMANLAHAEYGMNLTEGVTNFSQEVYGLHMIVFWICLVIATLVFGVMIYSMFAHRKSKGVTPAQFSHSTKAEIIWTVIPILILVVIAIPATTALINMEAPRELDENGKPILDADGKTIPVQMEMTIKVTGFQWKWKYDYLGEGVSILSSLKADSNAARQANPTVQINDVENYLLDVDNPLVLPVDTNIRILLTANDVIHSWWVPEFGWKRDAIPGYVNEAWTNVKEIGTYRGQCAELCGKDHGFMPIVVNVVSKEDYAIWLKQQKGEEDTDIQEVSSVDMGTNTTEPAAIQEMDAVEVAEVAKKWTKEELMARGKEVYSIECATCHQATGDGMGDVFPALNGSAIVNGDIDEQIKTLVFGIQGTAMTPFGDRLTESDIAATITYTRNAWGNTAKDVVKPEDVKRIKNS